MHTTHIYGWWFQPEQYAPQIKLLPPKVAENQKNFETTTWMCNFFMFRFPMVKTNTTRLRDQEAMDVVHWGHLVNVLA